MLSSKFVNLDLDSCDSQNHHRKVLQEDVLILIASDYLWI